jgi:transglutaminase-like putative cysteine protease
VTASRRRWTDSRGNKISQGSLSSSIALGVGKIDFRAVLANLNRAMIFLRALTICCLLARVQAVFGFEALSNRVDRLLAERRFSHASNFLQQEFSSIISSANEVANLGFEAERLERIRKDYPLTSDALFLELKGTLKGLTKSEYQNWLAEGRFDCLEIDGKQMFMGSSAANLLFRYPRLNNRRILAKNTAELERSILRTCEQIAQSAREHKSPYVLPKRFRVTMTVSLGDSGYRKPGDIVSAWLPIPRDYPFQAEFALVASSSVPKQIAPPDSPIRSVFFQQSATESGAATFSIDYDYTSHGVRFFLEPSLVRPSVTNDTVLEKYLVEAPHIIFTEDIRELSRAISGGETNRLSKARRFYEWISEHIQYSFALEYSTIRNLSDYCLKHRYGDCGQEALLFITLCRLNGIPARWQSGWNTFPGAKSIHDWSEIYLEPYGWIPVDPYMGIYAMQYATNLKKDQKLLLRDFYFGGLDQYRMIANSDHNQVLSPAKQALRSDPVDFQRGELECCGTNIYLDQFTYKLTVSEPQAVQKPE